ncbi:MAG: SlyX family protein [Afipia sp.]|nr:SlyX family protein [Afipia sp.]
MTDPDSSSILGERIDALEMRIAYQDDTIETLNKTVTEQWRRIDALSREVLQLRERVEEAEMKSRTASGEPEIPPHY